MTKSAAALPSYSLVLGSMSFAIFLTVTGFAMFGPLLVVMSVDLGQTVPVVGQLVTLAAATWGVFAIAVGPVSDTYGRKPVLLLGTSFLAVGAAGIALSPNFAVAIGFSLLLGVGGAMVPPTCIALAGDTFSEARRPMSIAVLTSAPGVSSLIGVPITALIADFFGWRYAFMGLGLSLSLAAALLLVALPDRRRKRVKLDIAGRLHWVLSFPVTWYVVGTNALSRICWGIVVTFFPAYLIVTYELGIADVALPMAALAIWATVAPMVGGRIGRSQRRTLLTTALLFIAPIPALGTFLLDWGVWYSVITAGLLMLLIVPVTTVLSIVFAETGGASRGTLAGLISSTNWGGTAVGAAIGGLLVAQIGYGALSLFATVVLLAGALSMILLVNDNAIERAREYFARSPGDSA